MYEKLAGEKGMRRARLCGNLVGLMLVKGHEDITGNSRHGIHGKGGQGRLDVIHEDMLKMCAVLALQPNLVIVD